MTDNSPFYEPENPYQQDQDALSDIKRRTDLFEHLCYQVFVLNDDGKDLYEMLKDQFLLSSGFNPNHPNANNLALYWEGIREVVRGLGLAAVKHQKRVNNVG